jgi:hypothetical protein
MSPGERRLAALAALFTPGRAAVLLGRVRAAGASGTVAHAERLAAATRRERLQALAAAMTVETESARARAEDAAELERPRIAALLRGLEAGATSPAASAVLLRICRERIGR